MKARYTRLYAHASGASHFADLEIELSAGFAVPPVEPLHRAQFLAPDATFWIGAPTKWNGEIRHPAPRRAIFVTASGEYEVAATDGAVRRFPPGSVFLLEDTTGEGHSTRITSSGDCIMFAVGLPATSAS